MFFGLLFLLQSHLALAENKIIYFISPPRSLSVAFLRMMEARKDFAILHEPSQWAYVSPRYSDEIKGWFREDAPATYDDVKKLIFEKASHSNVFVKEISFAVRDFLLQDKELIKMPNVYFVFLVRDPHHSVISFYKKSGNVGESFSRLIGYQAQYDLFQHIKEKAVNPPVMVLSEDLYLSPSETVQTFCKKLDIPFVPESLHWEDRGESFSGEEWNEIKHHELTHWWHGDAIRSTGFGTPSKYELDEKGIPTFTEVSNLADREVCRKAYLTNKGFYDLLLALRE